MNRLIITESEYENPETDDNSNQNYKSDFEDNPISGTDSRKRLSPGREIIALMQTAANILIGKENFFEKNFRNISSSDEVRKLDEGEIDLEIGVSFVSKTEIKRLNSTWRGKHKDTDVLSFPQYDFAALTEDDEKNLLMVAEASKTISLGDVVICVAKAKEQAAEFGHSQEREIVYLFVHSLLHLLGRDHANDEEREKMRVEEEAIMEEMGLTR